MRRDDAAKRGPAAKPLDPESLQKYFDRPEIAAVYLFGSMAGATPHPLSDVDLAFLGVSTEAEERLFDELYETLQRVLGEGRFDLVPLRRAPLHLQFTVATEGRPVLVRDPIEAEAFAARAVDRYLDFKPHRDRYFAAGR